MDKNGVLMDKTFVSTMIIPQPYLVDVQTRHAPGEWYDRPPEGSAVLAMCFRSRGRILTASGMEEFSPGECIFHTPDFPRKHGSDGEGFCNDWCYVAGAFLLPRLQALELPCNRLLATGNPALFEDALREVKLELWHHDRHSEQMIAAALEKLLITVRRAVDLAGRLGGGNSAELLHYPAFQALRTRLINECRRNFTVAEMAASLHLSPNRFAGLYKAFFGVTPYATLLEARLMAARYLLHSGTLPVKEIARQCGWSDEYYFARFFKRRTGLTPGEFRRGITRRAIPVPERRPDLPADDSENEE